MIVRVKVPQGVKVSGTLTKPGEHKMLGNKPAFILNVEAASEKRDGRWENYYVDVKIWGEHPEMEDMYQKGDYIEAEGREIEDRPGKNGTVYHSLTAKDVKPGGLVILRWMQQAIDAMLSASPQEPPLMAETDEDTPFDPPAPRPQQTSMASFAAAEKHPPDVPPSDIPPAQQMYPGEALGDYAPRSRQPVPEDDLSAPLDDEADLPW